ncbi:MAG: hypothetical protein LBP90_02815 [Burkholderiales bacterium]|jgi:hypothetical protein|nr:hypothetical protein [Burkholderiales bacterium]
MFSRAFSRISFLLAIFAAVLMTACGGGSGSPSEYFAVDLNESRMAYGPIKLEIYGGGPPFSIRTNSTAVEFPLESDSRTVYGFVYPVGDDGVGVVEVWDKVRGFQGRVNASFVHVATEIEPSALTVTAGPGANCTTGSSGDYTQICSGSQGVAELQLGNFIVYNQPVRFSVVLGDFEIRANTAAAWGLEAMTTADSQGKAQVAIRAKANVPTQTAIIRAEIGTGEWIETSFIIVGPNFTISPTSASWTSSGTTCPSRTASFSLYGGNPPYTVSAGGLGTVSPPTVLASGGSVVLTVDTCVSGELTARDATGSVVSANVSYTASGTAEEVTPDVVVQPVGSSWGGPSTSSRVPCNAGSIFGFMVSGGTQPYSAYVIPMGPNPVATMVAPTLGQVTFSAAPSLANSNFTIYVVDSKGKSAVTSKTIY